MATEAIEWVDCHEEFKKCVSQLSPGMVVTAPNIRLQDIISAVEILDPRTDFHSDFQCVRSLDDLCRDGEVPTAKKILDTFGEEDYTGVFEILWVRLFQWLEGRTLPQSLFSCTYMHELERLESVPILHAFMCGLLKVVSYCTEVIARADVREEDEFPLFSFNVNLCAECDTRSVLESLEKIENLVTKKKWSCALPHIQLCKSLLILVSRLDVGMKEVEKGLIPFLHEMKIHIDKVNEAVKKGEIQSGTVPFAHRSASKSLFHEATTRWVSAMTPLNYIPYDALLAKAETFSKTIGAYFRKLVDDLHEICEGLHFFSEDVTEMLSFVLDFSARAPCLVVRSWLMTIAYHGETQVLFGRCNMSTLLLQTFTKRHGCATLELMANGEENTLKNVTRYRIQKLRELKKYCPDFVLPDTSNEKDLLEMTRQQIIDFMNRLGRFVLHALFAVLNNRARYRRRLGNIFSELALLQKLAWEMDVNIFCGGFSCLEHYFIAEQSTANAGTCEQCHAAQQAIILSAFVVDLVARCMLDFTLLGIELELYAVEELPYAYGYTGNILTVFGENYSVLYKPKDFLVRNHLKNKKTTQRLFPPIVNAREMCLPSQSILHRHDLLRLMTAGTERTHQILVRVELLCPTGVRSINTLQHKYNHRFQVFEDLLRPSMFRFEACQRHIDAITMGGDVAHVIASAVQIFEHLMTRFEETRQILSKTAERLCQRWKQASMANLICVRLVKSLMGHEGIKEYTAVAEYHHGWITYKLVRKNTLDGGRVKA